METTIDYASDYDGGVSDYQTTMKRLSTMGKRLSNDYASDFLEVKRLWQKILRASDFAR